MIFSSCEETEDRWTVGGPRSPRRYFPFGLQQVRLFPHLRHQTTLIIYFCLIINLAQKRVQKDVICILKNWYFSLLCALLFFAIPHGCPSSWQQEVAEPPLHFLLAVKLCWQLLTFYVILNAQGQKINPLALWLGFLAKSALLQDI